MAVKSAGDPDPMTYRALVELSARVRHLAEEQVKRDQANRDGHIRELFAMGWHPRAIGELVGLTPQRVVQIVRNVA